VLFDGTPRLDGQLPDVRTMTQATAVLLDHAIVDVDWATPPAHVQRVTFDAPSGELAGLTAGDSDAPRILLIPGVTGSKEDFALMVPLLVGAGYRVDAYDLAGQYESANAGPERLDPPRARYDHDLFVEDLLAVLRTGRTPAHVLGYSFAGTVAQLAAVREPELFASLTLLSTPPRVGQTFAATKSVLGPLSRVTTARQGSSLMYWGLRRNLNRVPDHRYRFVVARLPVTRRAAVDDVVALMRKTPDVRAQIAALPIPKLVVFGTHDLWPAKAHRAYARAIGAEAIEYASGHSPCEDAPHQLCRDMIRVIEAPHHEDPRGGITVA